MQYVAAFESLGYRIENPRQDWSAEKDNGVCITIWQKERSVYDGLPYLDLWELHPNGGEWIKKTGHWKRTAHITRAVNEFAGRVDVIFVSGTPGEAYKDASPWIVEQRRGHFWHVSKFDLSDGYFRAEIFKAPAPEEARN